MRKPAWRAERTSRRSKRAGRATKTIARVKVASGERAFHRSDRTLWNSLEPNRCTSFVEARVGGPPETGKNPDTGGESRTDKEGAAASSWR